MPDEKPRIVKGASIVHFEEAAVADLVWSDGEMTSYAYTELEFRESEFIGKTEAEIEALFAERDRTT